MVRALDAVAAVCLLLGAATLAAWASSEVRSGEGFLVSGVRVWGAVSSAGELCLSWHGCDDGPPPRQGWVARQGVPGGWVFGNDRWSRLLPVRVVRGRGVFSVPVDDARQYVTVAGPSVCVVVEYRCAFLVCATVVALRASRRWSDRRVTRRLTAGCCPACGYDLRATPGSCPECGPGAVGVGTPAP